jgi:hypothetical protein
MARCPLYSLQHFQGFNSYEQLVLAESTCLLRSHGTAIYDELLCGFRCVVSDGIGLEEAANYSY